MLSCLNLLKLPYTLLRAVSRKITDLIFDSPFVSSFFNVIFAYLGPFLIGIFLLLFFVDAIAFFYDILPLFYYVYSSFLAVMFCAVPKLFTSFCMVFNYLMSIFTNPGYYRQPEQEKREQDLEGIFTKTCSKCQQHKPRRAHHCSVCKVCVLKMDHHCREYDFICPGHHNHQYFLLFTLYLVLDLGWNAVVNLWIELDPNLKNSKYKFSDIYYYSIGITISLLFILFLFNLWNWMLALNGQTTIEFWGSYYARDEEAKQKYSYRYKSKSKNLEVVFGTSSVCGILLPLKRKLSFDGLFWPSESDLVENI